MTDQTEDQMIDEHERVSGPVHDQISAFIDDELSDQETAFLVRRFERDAEARKQLVRYTTIGCALRGELLQPDPAILRRRIDNALNGGVAAVATRTAVRSVRGRKLVRPLLGVGIAAGVALAAVGVLQSMNEARVTPAAGLNTTPIQARQWTEPPSYVVPQDVVATRAAAPIRLTNYLVHHGEYASRLSRTSVHSNVVGASDSPPKLETTDSPE